MYQIRYRRYRKERAIQVAHTISRNIKLALLADGKSQKALADALAPDTSRTRVSNIATGKKVADAIELYVIAEFFRRPVTWFYEDHLDFI